MERTYVLCPQPKPLRREPRKPWVSPKLETASCAVSALEIVFLPSVSSSLRGLVPPGSLHTPAHTHACTHTCCPNGPSPHPAPSLPPTGPADRGTVREAPQAPARLREDAHTGDGAGAPRTDPRAGRGGGGGRRTSGWPDRLTGMGRGRQAAGGGDGREEDEGAGRRHLVEDGREVEVVAAGEEGGAGPQPPAMGTRSTLTSPRPRRGSGDAGQGEGGAAYWLRYPPPPL